MSKEKSICLVTEELSVVPLAGGIGGALRELAGILAQDHHVTILFAPPEKLSARQQAETAALFASRDIRLLFLEPGRFSHDATDPAAISHAVFRQLLEAGDFDIIHVHDRKGMGYHSLCARDQGLAFANTVFVVGLRGPERWVLEQKDELFTEAAQLKTDFMERQSIARADYLVSPGRHLPAWLAQKGWAMPPRDRCLLIGQPCHELAAALAPALGPVLGPVLGSTLAEAAPPPAPDARQPVSEIIFPGRHGDDEGFSTFCDALDRIAPRLEAARIRVTFPGRFGQVGNEHSGSVLAARGRRWHFPVRLLPFDDPAQTADYLAHAEQGVAVIPSPLGDATQALLLGRPVLASDAGGAPDLLAGDLRSAMTFPLTAETLAERLLLAIDQGLPRPRLAAPPGAVAARWRQLYAGPQSPRRPARAAPAARPLVSLCITHYERVEKLVDAIASVARQTYPEIELIVVDDGSSRPETRKALAELQPAIESLGGRLILRRNGYLGAARNTGAAAARGDYLCFLDDDDIALPDMVEKLVTAAQNTGADIVTCMQIFMPEHRRHEAWPSPGLFANKLDHHPLGAGPLSLAPVENVFGPATALFSRRAFDRVGGYTELQGVGHEDYELFLKAAQADLRIELCPFPLYLYEVGRSSMISQTPVQRNFGRVTNAIDMARQPEAWHDFLRLESGRRAREVIVARGQAAASVEGIGAGAGPQQLLRRLAEHAAGIGSPGLAAAYRNACRFYGAERRLDRRPTGRARLDLIETTSAAANAPAPPVIPTPPALSPGERLAWLRDAATDGPARVRRIIALLEASGTVSGVLIAELRFLAGLELDPAEVRRLIAALAPVLAPASAPVQMDDDARSALLGALFAIAARAGLHAKAEAFMADLFALGERGYLEANPDVAAAIGKGGIVSGMHHFLRYGEAEGRGGFDGVVQAGILYNRVHGTAFNLLQVVKSLKKSIPPAA